MHRRLVLCAIVLSSFLTLPAFAQQEPFNVPVRLNMGGVETEDSYGRIWLGDGPGPGDPLNIRPDDRGGTNTIENWELQNFKPDSLQALGFDPDHPGDHYIFNTIRWDVGNDATDFRLEIPVLDGDYTVNMYFTEGCCTGRHFKIEIQGEIADDDVSYLDYDQAAPDLGRTGRLQFNDVHVTDGVLKIGLLPCPECGAPDVNAIVNAIEVISGPGCDHLGLDLNCAYDFATGEGYGTWTPVPNAEGYRILKNGQPLGPDVSQTTSSFSDPNPPAAPTGTSYTVQVLDGGVPASECRCAVKNYACPGNLTCTVDEATSTVAFAWNPPSAGLVTGYEVRRDGDLIATLPADALAYEDVPPVRSPAYVITPKTAALCSPMECKVAVSTVPFAIPLRINMGGVETVDSHGDTWLGDGPGTGDPLGIRVDDLSGVNTIENWEIFRFQPDSLEALGFDPNHPGDAYIFNTIRWDVGADGIDFRLEIAVPNDTYTVNCYFTEGCCTNRHFQIEIQGDIVDDDVSYLDYGDQALVGLGRTGRLSFQAITVEDEVLRIGFLPCPLCPGATDTNAIINAIEVLRQELPASVARDLPKDTFGLGETVQVSIAINAREPNTPIKVREKLPALVTAGEVSDGGQINGQEIAWDLAAVSQKTITYKITPASCAGELLFDGSWESGTTVAKVRGEDRLSRAVPDQDPGPWESLDVGAAAGAAEPLGDHDLLVQAGGAGIVGQSDELRFIHVPQTGDFELSTRIDCFDAPGNSSQAGLMARDTLEGFSAHAFFGLSSSLPAGGGVGTLRGLYRRETAMGRTNSPITISDRDVVALPVYLKLARVGERIAFLRSADGVTYTEVGFKEIGTRTGQVGLKATVLAGLAVSGGGATVRCTFRAVSGAKFTEEAGPTFRRGDINVDGKIDVTDPVNLLGYLFLGGAKPQCLDAGDTDDDGKADISDAVSNLGYQFLGGAEPAGPGPLNCGKDKEAETPDLGCDTSCL